jgi:hypothetical protein
VLFNLRDAKNDDLRRRLLNADVDAAALATMTSDDLASGAEKARRQKEMEWNFQCRRTDLEDRCVVQRHLT